MTHYCTLQLPVTLPIDVYATMWNQSTVLCIGCRFISPYNANYVFGCTVLLRGIHQITSPIWLRWAGHIFVLQTTSTSTSFGREQGWANVHSWSLVTGMHSRCAPSLNIFTKRLKWHVFCCLRSIATVLLFCIFTSVQCGLRIGVSTCLLYTSPSPRD